VRLIVTGGGTGGHVFPALELARTALDKSVYVAYFGSHRGQEGAVCKAHGIPFVGFPSEPIYSLRSLRGLKALVSLARARKLARRELQSIVPDVVFSTGGYSSAPVVSAAESLGIPVVIHEQNSVPGRTNKLLAQRSFAVATTFHSAAQHFSGCNVVRTGLPVRRELRRLAEAGREQDLMPLILAVGGSQGAQAINEAVLGAAQRMVKLALHWLHLTGKNHFQSVYPSFEKLGLKDSYDVKPFLDGDEMGMAYQRASLAVCRAGASTLAELAAFRLPSVTVPYPHAFADHQAHNAKEFEVMGATSIVRQDELHPSSLEDKLVEWLNSAEKREHASRALAEWDAPDASERIFELVQLAVSSNRLK
jgi:UDP-N-acetylglucosamine--N-acetylmuramyl-(pentapeptide) pyrophosphoryl-undecaprenol N-acetylglucosamine transferase